MILGHGHEYLLGFSLVSGGVPRVDYSSSSNILGGWPNLRAARSRSSISGKFFANRSLYIAITVPLFWKKTSLSISRFYTCVRRRTGSGQTDPSELRQ